jgi:hypothetical protein
MRRTASYLATATLAVGAAALVACVADQQPLAPQSTVSSLAASSPRVGQRGLLGGDSLAFFVCHGNTPDTGSAVIGPLGGRVAFGPHELDVPPGALLFPTTITARTLASDTIAVQFEPQGTQFLVPATLQLSYAQCNPQPTGTLSIVYVNDPLTKLLGLIESILDPTHHRVIGFISHFSVYAVAE